ncbi:MAG TPA: WG repeat-containing protein [Candidatus Egerieousia sp.]|nr:WG repeat-containing protein [Candidatus Egerieousia sp.]HPT06233.1 WG repeat-containing protein [Candidatus Egerieousia sp.]
MKKIIIVIVQLFIVSIMSGQEKIVFPRSIMNKEGQLIYSNLGRCNRLDEIMLGCGRIFPWVVKDSALCKKPLYASYKYDKRVYVDVNGNLALRNVYLDANLFSENLAAVENDSLSWGFIDTLGNVMIPAKYEYAGAFSEGRAYIKEGEKCYNINHKGEIASLNFSRWVGGKDNWSAFADSDDKYADGTRYAFAGENDKMITRYIYEGYQRTSYLISDFICAKRDGKWGYINVKTLNEDIPFVYDCAYDFSEGLACVVKGNKSGYINEKGQVVIPMVYDKRPAEGEDEAYPVINGFVRLLKSKKWGFADKTGRVITQFIYDDARDFIEERAAVCKDHKWGFIDKTGRAIVAPLYDYVGDYYGGYACVKRGEKYGAINKNGKIVIPVRYENMDHSCRNRFYADALEVKASKFNEKCFSVEINGKWGVVDTSGNIIVQFVYDGSVDFSNGYAIVGKNKKYGIIDSTGKIVVPCLHNYIVTRYYYSDSDLLPYKMRAIINPAEQIFEIGDGEKRYIRYFADMKGNCYVVPFTASQYADYYADVKMHGFWNGDKGWMGRGEFEKTEDYEKRTDPHICALKVLQFKAEARELYRGLVALGTELVFTIGDYDADNECFRVHENCFGDSKLSVPIKDAQNFKKIWSEAYMLGPRPKIEAIPEYRLNGEHVDLASVTFAIVSDGMDTVKYHTVGVFKYAGDGYRRSLDSDPYWYVNNVQREADEARKKVEERNNEQKEREEIKKKQESLAADSAKVAGYVESMEEYMAGDNWKEAEETANMLYSDYSTILMQNRERFAFVCFVKAYAFFKRNLDFNIEANTDASAYFKVYRGEAESLVEKCTQSINVYPDYSNQAYFYRGIAYIILNSPDNAASDFRAAMGGDASLKGICYYNIGISYKNYGWYNDAITQFKLARSYSNDDKLSNDALDRIKNCQEKLDNK